MSDSNEITKDLTHVLSEGAQAEGGEAQSHLVDRILSIRLGCRPDSEAGSGSSGAENSSEASNSAEQVDDELQTREAQKLIGNANEEANELEDSWIIDSWIRGVTQYSGDEIGQEPIAGPSNVRSEPDIVLEPEAEPSKPPKSANFVPLDYPELELLLSDQDSCATRMSNGGSSYVLYTNKTMSSGSRCSFTINALDDKCPKLLEIGVTTCDLGGLTSFREHLVNLCGEDSYCGGRSASLDIEADIGQGDTIRVDRLESGHMRISWLGHSKVLHPQDFEWMPEVSLFVILNGSVSELCIRDYTESIVIGSRELVHKNEVDEGKICEICLDREKNCIFLDCAHVRTCFECAKHIMNTDGFCPFCRMSISEIKKVFL